MNYDKIDCIAIIYDCVANRNHPSGASIKKECGFTLFSPFHEVSVIDVKIIIEELKSDQA